MSTSVLFSTFSPFPTLSLLVPSDTRVECLYGLLCARYATLPTKDSLNISSHSGSIKPNTRVGELHGGSSNLVTLRIVPRLPGGKGGFGSQLRAAGGRMSSQKTNNNDSCRDLNGRRLSTIKTAKRLVKYVEDEEERKKAATEAKKAKLDSLERKIAATSDPEAGPKRRFDDTEFLKESQEIVDNVESAVTAGLLRKKKKVKVSDPTTSATLAAATTKESGSTAAAVATTA